MIAIGSSTQEMDPAFLEAPGGFAWWYLDLIAPQGDGLVLIWAYGLPFLPGYAAAARRGRPQRPRSRPSLNLATYRAGRPDLYLLQEVGTGDETAAAPAGEGVSPLHPPNPSPVQHFGASTLRSWLEGGRRRVEARLDCALPGTGERLTGTVTAECAALQGAFVPAAGEPHLWTPLTGPGAGEARLALGGRALAPIAGRAYHDRNGGSRPLHALGMRRWMWGRFPLPGRELIYYLLWPEAGGAPRVIGLEVDAAGRAVEVEGLEVELGRERRTLGGLLRPERLRLLRPGGGVWVDVEHVAVVDSGPFYLRFQSVARAGGEAARGWGELCVPARVDLPWHRPLVRMRVHRPGAGNSPWLPLFTGPRAGRVRRLAGQLWPGGGR